MTKNVCRDDVHQENAHELRPFLSRPSEVSLFYTSEARLFDPVLHAAYSVPMSALAGLMVPKQPLVADLSYDQRVPRVDLTHRKWSHPASHVTRELQPRSIQTLATEITCLGATSCLSGPSPHLGTSASK